MLRQLGRYARCWLLWRRIALALGRRLPAYLSMPFALKRRSALRGRLTKISRPGPRRRSTPLYNLRAPAVATTRVRGYVLITGAGYAAPAPLGAAVPIALVLELAPRLLGSFKRSARLCAVAAIALARGSRAQLVLVMREFPRALVRCPSGAYKFLFI
jgi:hypothetical protein